ncbi:hypothetical protein TSOC_006915 [Tetrabaena socialis]|uniref:Uncharacterized protein n=1 Tax=Tetrabaena socialis TaxID=47790 RepID=A0A2J8A2G4_9CHLO|nr:hypothetical protein TSOC_006915 [Tetrabaena socialis]|eukprot:PNH06703.1 hypothetical protein TSOC_006915 [Tetrabaena socialis]
MHKQRQQTSRNGARQAQAGHPPPCPAPPRALCHHYHEGHRYREDSILARAVVRSSQGTKRSKASATPPSSCPATTTSAAARTPGTALPMATPSPAPASMARSLPPSPTAMSAAAGSPRWSSSATQPPHLFTPAGTISSIVSTAWGPRGNSKPTPRTCIGSAPVPGSAASQYGSTDPAIVAASLIKSSLRTCASTTAGGSAASHSWTPPRPCTARPWRPGGGALVSSSELALFQLAADAKHPRFKELSALVKEGQAAEPFSFTSSL